MNTALVFIHGSGDSGRIWQWPDAVFDAHPTIMLDLPGHGARADTLPPEATVLDYTRAVQQIVQEELQLQQPIIAGHSLGGAIALQMALEYPDAYRGIILIGTGARLRVLPALLEATREQPEEAQRKLAALALSPGSDQIFTQLQQEPRQPSALYRDLAACNTFDVLQRLHEIQIPTLILCGAEDRLTPVKFSVYLHEHIAHSTLQIIENAGHYVMREQPEIVILSIRNWLKQVKSSH